MTWAENVRFKLRAVHTEMAELRRYIQDRGLPEAEAEHLFRGHLRSLDALALEKLPLAVAMDTSDILVRYQGKDAHAGRCPITKMNRLFTNLRDQVVEMTKSHGQLSGSRFRWSGDVDLLVTACTPSLIFGFKLPEPGVTRDQENRMLLDPHYTALKDSLDLMGVVASSLQHENPRTMIDEFAAERGVNVDECFIDSGLVAARKLLPARDRRLESVEIAGRVVSGSEGMVIDRERWERADHIIRANHVPRDTLEIAGFLMAVDYEVSRFTLRQLDGWKVRGVRCRYREEHEEFVRNHGKKKIWVKGRACFDRERQPRFVEVDDLQAA